MNIKSLLLGSAAALAAVSGAQAADAVVAAEPEPLEYVRICDAYGAGYFFIPGTETCLKIGGKVRTEGQWGDAYGGHGTAGDWRYGTLWHTRAELNINTATDTEYGPLKTNTILRWDWSEGGSTGTNLLWSYISLGGFSVGKQDSQYNQFVGYAGDVINDDVIYDGPYELNQITYNYDAGNGFTAVVSVEDSNSAANISSYGGAWETSRSNHYAPNVVAGAGYKAGAWSFKVVGGYDSIVEEGAIKARIDADFGVFSAFLMGGWNTDGDKLNQYAGSNLDVSTCTHSDGTIHGADCGWGDWAVWGGVGVPINDKLKWNLQLAYTDSKIFAATTNIKWNPVKNLLIEPEVSYTNWDSISQDEWAGILRFERTF
ncbi:porin [Rhizobium calliandrae]|uniref:Porin n=2 Tax=Rhizobium TaxID=379 RepID=A0ABT7K8X2_9HYPH|nr:porin [Rhizobium calliandrae]MDL2404450.1 porin [Rhizobium calliandrae]